MLDQEHFRRFTEIEHKSIKSFDVIPIARRVSGMSTEGNPENDRGVYLSNGLRQYRVENVNGTINIEGHVLPPKDDDNASLMDRLGNIQALIPITIHTNGAIESEGNRISPHNPRLALLASDLFSPTQIEARVYQRNAAGINKNK